MKAYIKLFTTTPPTITKTYAISSSKKIFLALTLVVAAMLAVVMILFFDKCRHDSKNIMERTAYLLTQILGASLIVLAISTSAFLLFKIKNTTHQKVIASSAPKIEKRAVQAVHKEYPYVLEVG